MFQIQFCYMIKTLFTVATMEYEVVKYVTLAKHERLIGLFYATQTKYTIS